MVAVLCQFSVTSFPCPFPSCAVFSSNSEEIEDKRFDQRHQHAASGDLAQGLLGLALHPPARWQACPRIFPFCTLFFEFAINHTWPICIFRLIFCDWRHRSPIQIVIFNSQTSFPFFFLLFFFVWFQTDHPCEILLYAQQDGTRRRCSLQVFDALYATLCHVGQLR